MDRQELEQTIIATDPAYQLRIGCDRAAVEVPCARLRALLERLKNDLLFAFDMLLAHTAVDLPEAGKIELVYVLYSTVHGHYLMVWSALERNNPVAASVMDIWPTAQWQEREVFDLFGIEYTGHSDLRRMFLEDGWAGHPLRKDYQDPDMLERGQ